MIRYIPCGEKLNSDELGIYASFGMKILDKCGDVLLFISDVSPNKQFIHALCSLCTHHQLSPIHIYDVIADIL